MSKSLTKVIYRPENTSSAHEYTVIVNPEEYKKWKEGDTSIALATVLDSFSIFHSSQGHQGKLGQPSKQQLDTDFGTDKDDDVLKMILEKGKMQASDSIAATSTTTTNRSRGSGSVDLGRGIPRN